MRELVLVNGATRAADLMAAMMTPGAVEVVARVAAGGTLRTARGILSAVERESGDGRSFNVRFTEAHGVKTVACVRCV